MDLSSYPIWQVRDLLIWDSKAREGVFFGLSYDKTRAHMIRSNHGRCRFSLLHNLETAEEVGSQGRSP